MESWPKGKGSCTCMAQEHALFANCLTCGRVLCALDKEEMCPFCGEDPLRAPDMDRLMERVTSANGKQRLPPSLEEVQKRAARLVAADSQEPGAGVLEEAQDQTTTAFLQHPSYTPWQSIQEAKERYARAREVAENERTNRHLQLSSLLGLK